MIFVHRSNIVVSTGTMLSDIEEGELVKLNENGSPVEFYVAKHDYEPDLNGAGRTLLVRKDCYNLTVWTNTVANYPDEALDTLLNTQYKELLDVNIKEQIGETTFYCTPNQATMTLSTLARSVFTLSATELGITGGLYNSNVEGTILPISNQLSQAQFNGSGVVQWTRTPLGSGTFSFMVFVKESDGGTGYADCTSQNYYRPTFTLPSTILADDTGLIV